MLQRLIGGLPISLKRPPRFALATGMWYPAAWTVSSNQELEFMIDKPVVGTQFRICAVAPLD